MNGVEERFDIKWKQTAKGIWYCDGATVSTSSLKGTIELSSLMMDKVTETLKEKNPVAE